MRVTNNMLVNNLLTNINRNQVKMSKYQDQLATGKTVHSASDDPVATSKIIKYKTDLAEYAQYERNTSDALSWLEVTESTMMDINKVMQRARELAVAASNGVNSDEDVEKIGDELEQLKKQIISDGNFSIAGRYVFSGYHTEKKLFNEDGTYAVGMTDTDLDNPNVKKYQIGVGEDIEVSTNGLDLFGSVAETGPFVDKMPSGKDTNGVASKQSELEIEFDTTLDHKTAGQITYQIGTQNYDVVMTDLDLSAVDADDDIAVQAAKDTILNAIKNATQSPAPALPALPTTMSEVADVYFSADDKIIIRVKNYGNDSISQDSTEGLKDLNGGGTAVEGVATATIGNATTEASLSMGVITDPEVGTNFNDKEFVVTVNGKTERITIGTLPDPAVVADLVTSLQTAIDEKFDSGEIVVTEALGVISFTTNNVAGDGEKPSLEILPVKAMKSKMIQDFDDVILAIKNGDRDAVEEFLGKTDENMEKVLTNLSDLGARSNRMELVISRINENNVTFTKLLSGVQDADMSEVIMYLKNAENVYNASLSTGAKVIQPTLIDFLR